MIDLKPFTGKNLKPDWLNTPFNWGDKTIATNGHIMIAVAKREGYENFIDGAKRLAKYFDNFPNDFIDLPEFKPERIDKTVKRTWMGAENTKIKLDNKYLKLIKGLPGLKVAICSSDYGEETALYWQSDESRGVLMGLRE